MKTLQKYTNIALLLISATMIVPAYANSNVNEQEQVEQELIEQEKRFIEYENSMRGRIVRYIQNHKNIIFTSYCVSFTTIMLALKYAADKKNEQLINLLSVPAVILIMAALPLSGMDED